MERMEKMKEGKTYVMEERWIKPLGVWFSYKINVDGRHLRALNHSR